MGRLGSKSEENAATAPPTVHHYNVRYTKLKDDDYCESPEQVMPGFEGYISFSCRQCGHLQLFQGAELEMILGKSLKMAFRSNKKDQQQQQTGFEQQKNNIPMTSSRYQETPDDSAIGIPVVPPGPARYTLSSDESNSPTQLNQFKRIVEKPSLMKRIGKGFVLTGSDEEGYPLVSDGSSSIPGSQSNISLFNNDQASGEAPTLKLGDFKIPKQLNFSDQYAESETSTEEIELRSQAHRREANLRMAPWYQEGIPREIALEILSQEPIGSFMVRKSTTKAGCFALSVRVPRSFQPRGIAHYLIMRSSKGYKIKGFTKDFPTLASLIAHHSVMPELLPCPLSLSRYHPVCVISDCRREFADIEPEPDD
ncbi:unnamed protein product [Ceutorhynchus assimilis]|uniref:SH2 domain-containing protein n=1 Tax=Ceutorhynchus assimilis TaxID=467358 RepID=A0A9N9QHD0_9CUCU|nr:unnamed protein product [Ceutorhynchus assimilis]